MADQKIENLLNLALSASEEEREKSLELDMGYYPVARTWEVIIKYSGTLGRVREIAESVVELRSPSDCFFKWKMEEECPV